MLTTKRKLCHTLHRLTIIKGVVMENQGRLLIYSRGKRVNTRGKLYKKNYRIKETTREHDHNAIKKSLLSVHNTTK